MSKVSHPISLVSIGGGRTEGHISTTTISCSIAVIEMEWKLWQNYATLLPISTNHHQVKQIRQVLFFIQLRTYNSLRWWELMSYVPEWNENGARISDQRKITIIIINCRSCPNLFGHFLLIFCKMYVKFTGETMYSKKTKEARWDSGLKSSLRWRVCIGITEHFLRIDESYRSQVWPCDLSLLWCK